jgi:osmoprotectant transport system permease protein
MNGVWTFLTDPANWSGDDGIPNRLFEHLLYTAVALLIAAAIALPLGAWIGHTGRGAGLIGGIANALRALPSLGLLILLVLWALDHLPGETAITAPAIAVLVILGIPSMLTNTYAGISAVDPAARDAARGMGMTGGQVLRRVELPIALPLIFSGVRSAFLQIVATATIAAYVSLGGLGRYLIDGPKAIVNPYGIMAGGAVLVAVLAIVGDRLLALLAHLVISPGLTGRRTRRRAGPVPAEVRIAEAREQAAMT